MNFLSKLQEAIVQELYQFNNPNKAFYFLLIIYIILKLAVEIFATVTFG